MTSISSTPLVKAGIFAVCALLCSLSFAESGYLYRYENDEGVKVLHHTIPPEYVQNGYEVLASNGTVVQVVPPAPSDGQVAKAVAERRLRERFEVLKRRYSTQEDIERAKLRRLKNINTNIDILRGNIGGINVRIENLMTDAAKMERNGQKVSEHLLQQLADTKAELAVTEAALATRLSEYEEVAKRFDRDLVTFIAGSELKANAEESSPNISNQIN